jgi:hypothetical protein
MRTTDALREVHRIRGFASRHFYFNERRSQCELCGSEKQVKAHHESYFAPLDVIWLCHAHHMARHARLRSRGRDPRLDYIDARMSGRPAPREAAPVSSSQARTTLGCL